MTATEDAYRFEFVWTDGDRLPFDAWRGRPVFVVNTAAGSSAALTSVLTTPRSAFVGFRARGRSPRPGMTRSKSRPNRPTTASNCRRTRSG
jgi:hypothetical protein